MPINGVNSLFLILVLMFSQFPNPGRSTFEAANFTDRLQSQGYIVEEHEVVTEDGYILTMFRVKRRSCLGNIRHPPVVLQHGLLLSSDCWFDSGLNTGLGYLIQDACFDLWVPNTRGNYYSRNHISLNADKDPEFWDWSFNEIGKFDVPATIDYISKVTGYSQLNHIGFSQGSGSFVIMCSERPGYCDRVKVHIALAPATRFNHTTSVLLLFAITLAAMYEEYFSNFGIYEILSHRETTKVIMGLTCPRYTQERNCTKVLSLLDHHHEGSVSYETHQVLFDHFPAGTSIRNLIHFYQLTSVDVFRKYNFGRKRNNEVYRQATPPEYNLSLTTARVVIIQGLNDRIVDIKDVEWARNRFPNVLEYFIVDDPDWNHLDMAFSSLVPELLFPKIKSYLMQYSSV